MKNFDKFIFCIYLENIGNMWYSIYVEFCQISLEVILMLIDKLKVNAENGDAQAQYELACLYSYGDTIEGAQLNFEEALKWLRKSAKQKYPPAFNAIGLAYENGEGVKRDLKKALKWFKKASDAGDVVALRNLASCYKYGELVKKDLNLSKEYYISAYNTAKKLAESGDKRAQFVLGVCCEFGGGTEQNYEKAVEWYKLAAENGSITALTNLGVCYEFGNGVAKNLDEAVKCYKEAANRGHARAQTNLGVCYEGGNGVEQNYNKAIEWYQKAAKRNYASGQCFLAECYENGYGTDVNIEEAFKLYKKAAERGFDRAQYYLAECYRYGKGVKKNLKKAIYWYKKAADQDYWSAKYALDELKRVKKLNRRKSLDNIKDDDVFDIDEKFAEYERFLKEQLDIYDDEDETDNTFNDSVLTGQNIQLNTQSDNDYSELDSGSNEDNTDTKVNDPHLSNNSNLIKDEKEYYESITNSLDEIKSNINELKKNICTSELIYTHVRGIENFIERNKDNINKDEAKLFLAKQDWQNNPKCLDIFQQALSEFIAEETKRLVNEIEKEQRRLDQYSEKKEKDEDYEEQLSLYIKALKRKRLPYSEVFMIQTMFFRLQRSRVNPYLSSINGEAAATNGNILLGSSNSISKIFSDAITKATSAKSSLRVSQEGSFTDKQNEFKIKLYTKFEKVLLQKESQFENNKLNRKDNFIDDVISKINKLEQILDEGQVKLDNGDLTTFEEILEMYEDKIVAVAEEYFPKENEGREQ